MVRFFITGTIALAAMAVTDAAAPQQPNNDPFPQEQLTSVDPGIATLNLTVRDAQGGVIPGTNVRVTQAGTSKVRTLKTDARGRFSAPDLSAPRIYEVVVTLPGFRTTRDWVHVMRGETITLLVQLDLGTLTETVTVSSMYTRLYSSGQAAPRQMPANLETADDFFAAARVLYEQGRFEDAVAMNARAVAIQRADMPQAATAPDPSGPVRIGGSIKESRKIRHVPPIFPADAVAAGVEGTVVLNAVLGKDGAVRDVAVITGVPVLNDAALNAVRLWVFTPTLLNGVPVEVAMTVTVNFTR